MTSVALAIALFASVQVVAMERQVNPYLDENTKWFLEKQIPFLEERVDPNGDKFKNFSPQVINMFRKKLDQYTQIYYGNVRVDMYDIQKLEKSFKKISKDKY